MRKICLIFITTIVLSVSNASTINLEKQNIKPYFDVAIERNSKDENLNEYIDEETLPFTLVVRVEDPGNYLSNENAVIGITGNLKFADSENPLTKRMDKDNFEVRYENVIFTGGTNKIYVHIVDGGYEDRQEIYLKEIRSTPKDDTDKNSETSISGNKNNASSQKTPTSSMLTPYILIESFDYSSDMKPNIPFDINLVVSNVNSKLEVNNIIVELSPSSKNSEKLYFVGQTNIIYIPNIPANSSKKITASCLFTGNDNIASIDVKISGEYYEENKYTAKKTSSNTSLTLIRSVPSSIRLETIKIPDNIYLREEFPVEYRIANVGDSTLHYVDILVKTKSGKELARTFIGELKSEDVVNSPTIDLYFDNLGKQELIMEVSAKNEQGESFKTSTSFLLYVKEKPQKDDEKEKDKKKEKEKSSKSTLYVNESVVNDKQKEKDRKILKISAIVFSVIIIISAISIIIYSLVKKGKIKIRKPNIQIKELAK